MRLLIAILFSFISSALVANGDPNKNTIVLKGKVHELSQGESLTGVRVSVLGSDKVTFTDKDGFFELETQPDADLKIVFTLVSFESLTVDLPELDNGIIEVTLKEK